MYLIRDDRKDRVRLACEPTGPSLQFLSLALSQDALEMLAIRFLQICFATYRILVENGTIALDVERQLLAMTDKEYCRFS